MGTPEPLPEIGVLANQRPRKCDMTYRKKEGKKRDLDIMTTYALRAAAVKIYRTNSTRPKLQKANWPT